MSPQSVHSCRFTSISVLMLIVGVFLSISMAYAEDGFQDHASAPTTTTREKTVYFPQFQPVQSVSNEAYMVNQIVGKLTLSTECLRVVSGDKSFLLIWPGWYSFDIVSRDIVISNLRTGAVVAQLRINDTISLTGGELQDRPFGLKYVIPDQCNGPYWAVGEIQSARSEPPPKKEAVPPVQAIEKPQSTPLKKHNYVAREKPEKPPVPAPIKIIYVEREKPIKPTKKYSPPVREPSTVQTKKTIIPPKPANDMDSDPEFEKSMVR